MKKRMILLDISLILILLLCACGKSLNKKDLQLSELNGAVFNDRVQMFILQRTITDETESAAVQFQNLTEQDYSFDAGQRLEALLDGNWYVIPAKSEALTMALYHLPAGGTESGEILLAGSYDKLPEGSYRVVKTFVSPEGEQTLAAAEFVIGRG